MLIVIDVETTGTAVHDGICSCALLLKENDTVQTHYELVKPPCRIKKGAMAIHHITNEMVNDAASFKDSGCFQLLGEYNISENIMVAFEGEFIHNMLQKEGVVWQGETINLKHCIFKEISGLESYALQYLRYELGIYKKEDAYRNYFKEGFAPHHALGDTLLTYALYEHLRENYTLDALLSLSNAPVLIKTIGFGKYKHKELSDVIRQDPDYFLWLREQSDIDEDLRYSIDHYINKGLES